MATIDALYSNPHVTLCFGLVVASLIVFSDRLHLCASIEFWVAINAFAFVALLQYEANPTLAFMTAALMTGVSTEVTRVVAMSRGVASPSTALSTRG